AAMGARDVTVANPDGQSVVLTGGFAVAPPPPTLGLAFLGKLRDKVGQGNTAFSADGALDGSFRVTVQAGSGARTVTRLELSRAGGGGVWDTDPATAHWALGAAGSLDGGLLNSGTGTVSFGVTDGGTFFVFAADPSSVFTSGASFTLTANFADGASASASASVPFMPTISSVSPSTGVQGANLTVTVTGTNFQAGASAAFGAGITVNSTQVAWDTDPATANWALGASAGLDGALLNSGTGTVSFGVVDGAEFFVFASDFGPAAFTTGSGFSLTVTLADGSVATVQTTIP